MSENSIHSTIQFVLPNSIFKCYPHLQYEYQEQKADKYFFKSKEGKLVGAGEWLPMISEFFYKIIPSSVFFIFSVFLIYLRKTKSGRKNWAGNVRIRLHWLRI